MAFSAGCSAEPAALRATGAASLRATGRAIAAAAIAALTSPACATFGLDGNVYHGDGFSFRLPPAPSAWDPIDVSDAALAYRDEPSGGTILINGRCDKDGDDVPLRSLTQHLFMRFTEREVTREETVPFDGREALHTVITAKLDGVPKSFSTWVLKKDGCVFDLVYVSDPERFGAGAERFDAYATRLHVLPREGDEGP